MGKVTAPGDPMLFLIVEGTVSENLDNGAFGCSPEGARLNNHKGFKYSPAIILTQSSTSKNWHGSGSMTLLSSIAIGRIGKWFSSPTRLSVFFFQILPDPQLDSVRGVWPGNRPVSSNWEPASDFVPAPKLPASQNTAVTEQTPGGETTQGRCADSFQLLQISYKYLEDIPKFPRDCIFCPHHSLA